MHLRTENYCWKTCTKHPHSFPVVLVGAGLPRRLHHPENFLLIKYIGCIFSPKKKKKKEEKEKGSILHVSFLPRVWLVSNENFHWIQALPSYHWVFTRPKWCLHTTMHILQLQHIKANLTQFVVGKKIVIQTSNQKWRNH